MNNLYIPFFLYFILFNFNCGYIENKVPVVENENFKLNEDSIKIEILNYVDSLKFKIQETNVVNLDVQDKSSEGGIAKCYYLTILPININVQLYGVMGKSTQDYYYKNGEIIYALIIDTIYKEPIVNNNFLIDEVLTREYFFWGKKLLEKDSIVFKDGIFYKSLFLNR